MSLISLALFAVVCVYTVQAGEISCELRADDSSFASQDEFEGICPHGCARLTQYRVWGNGTYTDDSSICRAAVHDGQINDGVGGRVRLRKIPGQQSYQGVLRNNVETTSYGPWRGSFIFVKFAAARCKRPDAGWFALDNGYQYKILQTQQTWHESQYICGGMGGHLAYVGPRQARIRNLLKHFMKGQTYWIGLSDFSQEKQWRWGDGVAATAANTEWSPGQPDHLHNEDCGEMRRDFGFYQMNDWCCHEGCQGYAVCEKRL